MAATPQAVQAGISAGEAALAKTTSTYPAMVKKYGSDWHKWPATSNWHIAFASLEDAKTLAGQLVAPAPPHAAFTVT